MHLFIEKDCVSITTFWLMFCAVEVLLPAPSDRFARNAAHLFEIVKMIVLLSCFSMPCFVLLVARGSFSTRLFSFNLKRVGQS